MKHRGGRVAIFAIIALCAAGSLADAQFKVVGPAPFPPAVARQKIATLLQNADTGNRRETIQTLTGWLGWYRDLIDDELIASWRRDTRANLPEIVDALADSRVASEIVRFSWRDQRSSAFTLDYAPMFGRLMVRFPESATTFLDDLLARPAPNLAEPEAEAVCRVLLDMPDVGTWKKTALQVLPHYLQATQSLLNQDVRSADSEKSLQAKIWMNDLQLDGPASTPSRAPTRLAPGRIDPPPTRRRAVSPDYSASERPPAPSPAASPSPSLPPIPDPPAAAPDPPPTLNQRQATPRSAAVAAAVAAYHGPTSGTLESVGSPIPQNAEYVFRNLPAGQLKLDYDTKLWEARLAPGDGQTQRLIVRNKSSGPQKHCVVRWSLME